jgi:hypothetical protein
MQAYVKLRNAIYCEDGYCTTIGEIAPGGIKRESTVYLSTLDRAGKTIRIEPLAGCDGTLDPALNIPLTPYHDPMLGKAVVLVMCDRLGKAIAGNRKARADFAFFWAKLLTDAVGIARNADYKNAVGALASFYGRGRVVESLNKFDNYSALYRIDHADMVREALTGVAA